MLPRSLFLIDLSAKRVFCTSCKKACRSLELTDCTQFWCASKSCDNSEEVRVYPGNRWEVFAVSETLRENAISEITTELILSIGAPDE
jgi:hypothetical protein